MGLASLPTLTVEVAFTTDPTSSTPVWTDISAYVRSGETLRGRQYELDRFEAGTLRLVLLNTDRRFDPTYTGGPYYGNLLPMRKIRVKATWNAVTYTIFTGYVERWPPAWDIGNTYSEVEITAVDGFGVFRQFNLAAAPQVLMAKFQLGNPGTFTDYGSYPSGEYSTAYRVFALMTDTPTALPRTVTVTYKNQAGTAGRTGTFVVPSSAAAGDVYELVLQAGDSGVTDITAISATGGTGTLHLYGAQELTLASVDATALPATVTDMAAYPVGEYAFAVDAVVTKKFPAGSSLALQITYTNQDGTTGRTATCTIFAPSEVGDAWPVVLQTGDSGVKDITAIATLGLAAGGVVALRGNRNKLPAALSGTQIGRVLDLISWPSAERTIDAGQTTIAGISTLSDLNVLQYFQDVADSELGQIFMGADGKVVFQQRSTRFNAPYTTIQATFGDAGGTEKGYTLLEPDYDVEKIYNVVRITRPDSDVVQTVYDATSKTRYFPRSLDKGTLTTSNDESYNQANYLLSAYKDPALAFRRLQIKPQADTANLWPQALGREISDRITVKRRPPGGGNVISQDCFIEQIQHTFDQDSWETEWMLSPVRATPGY